MIKPIFLYGSEVLRRKAPEFDLTKKEDLAALVQDLKDTLKASDGCGLAAPQIGVSTRVLIVDGGEVEGSETFARTMVNPVIVSQSETECVYNEGCLSVPGIYSDVSRPESITVRYYDESLREVTEDLKDFNCRMVQHEMSHLDGCLFVDLVTPIRRKMIAGKLSKVASGKVATPYNSKIK